MTTICQGRADTANARRYMIQLCKHWSHRFAVRYDDEGGEAPLPGCVCRMRVAPDHLAIALETDDPGGLERMKSVVVEHLQRFAFREPFAVVWREAVQGSNMMAETSRP